MEIGVDKVVGDGDIKNGLLVLLLLLMNGAAVVVDVVENDVDGEVNTAIGRYVVTGGASVDDNGDTNRLSTGSAL